MRRSFFSILFMVSGRRKDPRSPYLRFNVREWIEGDPTGGADRKRQRVTNRGCTVRAESVELVTLAQHRP